MLFMEIRYRTETCYGSGERDAVSVMVYETFELGNTDILQTLENGLLKNQPELRNKCSDLIDEMNNNGAVEDYGENEWRDFYEEVLKIIQKETGIHVKYVLWLADKEAVMDSSDGYGSYVLSEEDIDAYEIGPVVLSELGYDGTLYGYEEYPEPIQNLDIIIEDIKKMSLDELLETSRRTRRFVKQNENEIKQHYKKKKTNLER